MADEGEGDIPDEGNPEGHDADAAIQDEGNVADASRLLNDMSKCSVFRKEFKLTGQVGTSKGCLSFTSLTRQIENGLARGYSEAEIVEAIIKAVRTGSGLSHYLEGIDYWTLTDLRAIIRSNYDEKSATELYTELCNVSQGLKEDCQGYLVRALGLRQQLLAASKESSDDSLRYNPELVQAMFMHSVYTGFAEDNIRFEMRSLLENPTVSDQALIHRLNQVSRQERERLAKIKGSSRGKTGVYSVETESEIQKLNALRAADQKELAALRKEITDLKKLVMFQ